MKKPNFKRLQELKEKRRELTAEIKREADYQYPKGSEILFKTTQMNSYTTGIVQNLHWFRGDFEINLINSKTKKRRCVCLHWVHPNYK